METQTIQRHPRIIPELIERLQQGEALIIPTDTVYAFIAHSERPEAIAQIAQLKHWQNPQALGILTHLEKVSTVAQLNNLAQTMMSHFPYPVTMIVPAKPSIPETVTAGHKNIMVLCPDNFVYDLVSAASFPIACTSVGYADIRATSFQAAMQLYGGKVPLIVDGGKSRYGRSGTLVNFVVETPAILKYGPISYEDLKLLLPKVELPAHMRK